MNQLLLSAILAGSVFAAKAPSNLPIVAQPPEPTPSNLELQKQIDDIKEALDIMTQGQFKGVIGNLPQIKAQMEAQRIKDSIAENTVHQIPEDGSPIEGPATAKVTLVEFSDMECPYCVKSAPRIKDIFEKYNGQVRVVYKHFPLSFHKRAKGAHAAARAAELQGKFFEYRYELAKQASGNADAALNDANYIKLAETLKLDMKKFKKDMAISQDDEDRFKKDQDLGAQVGVSGTPTYFINGKKADLRTMEDTINELLAK